LDSDSFGVNCQKISIYLFVSHRIAGKRGTLTLLTFEHADKVCFRRFLDSPNRSTLETKVALEVLGNLTDKALEGSLRMRRWKLR